MNRFRKIEKEYPVDKIEYNHEKVWAYLRISYILHYTYGYLSTNKTNKNNKYIGYFLVFKKVFSGFKNWFRRYEYIAFSNASRMRRIGDFDVDINLDTVIEKVGYSKCLYIDSSDVSYKSLNIKYYLVHLSLIKLFIKISSLFYTKNVKKNSTLEEIHKKEQINIDYQNIIYKFDISVSVYKILFKLYKPKAIFSYCFTCGIHAAIKAANDLGIPIIEFQHGLIGTEHTGYVFYTNVDKSYYPKTLLTFGKYDAKIISSHIYNPFENVIPIGRYILNIIKEEKIPKELLDLKKSYSKVVSISTFDILEDKLSSFIRYIADLHDNILFLFSIRTSEKKENYCKFTLPKNIILYKEEYTCYDLLKLSDIHMTIASTCAIEALFFGKPTILVDIEGVANSHSVSKIESKNIYCISEPKEFSQYTNIDYITEDDNEIFSQNHDELLTNFLSEYLLNTKDL